MPSKATVLRHGFCMGEVKEMGKKCAVRDVMIKEHEAASVLQARFVT